VTEERRRARPVEIPIWYLELCPRWSPGKQAYRDAHRFEPMECVNVSVGADGGERDPHFSQIGRPRPAILCRMQAFEAKPAPLLRDSDGTIRVSGTRVSLETLVSAFDAGATAEELVQQYPSLGLYATYAVISYVLDHRAEVDAYVAKRREEAHALQGQIEGHSPPQGIRARLLARSRPPASR